MNAGITIKNERLINDIFLFVYLPGAGAGAEKWIRWDTINIKFQHEYNDNEEELFHFLLIEFVLFVCYLELGLELVANIVAVKWKEYQIINRSQIFKNWGETCQLHRAMIWYVILTLNKIVQKITHFRTNQTIDNIATKKFLCISNWYF